MTPDEAKQLMPGDRVLLEAEVTYANYREKPDEHMTFYGNVAVKVATCGAHAAAFWVVSPEAIREKLAPPRRLYKKGDIVIVDETDVFVIHDDERPNRETIRVDHPNYKYTYIHKTEFHRMQLVCPVEDRHDRKEES